MAEAIWRLKFSNLYRKNRFHRFVRVRILRASETQIPLRNHFHPVREILFVKVSVNHVAEFDFLLSREPVFFKTSSVLPMIINNFHDLLFL